MSDSYYRYHVFFCTNERLPDGKACKQGDQYCQQHDALGMRKYMKKKVKELGLVRTGEVRVNTAGCLNRCSLGPVIVIYPEAVWYTFVDKEDIDEIISEHLQNGRIVKRLKIDK